MSSSDSYMARALALARKALGTTSPNPAVGAVIVKDGRILGEGHTQPPGRSHAEVVALQHAGESSSGASLYVTLEPCCTYGRTPPCTRAIIAAGIAEVYVATADPNPRVYGKGLAALEAAGVTVHSGEGQEEARELYEAFAKHINTGLPFVTAKFAMSVDGKIATHTGDSKWVTGAPARSHVQEMRRACDAIMVGVNTVLEDDPQLTARDQGGDPLPQQPLRVIMDTGARTPPTARLLKEPGKTLVAMGEQKLHSRTLKDTAIVKPAPEDRVLALEQAGAEVLRFPLTEAGMVDPRALLEALGARGTVSLLVEGGGTLLGSMFDLGLVDKVAAFVAPVIIGGSSAPSPVGGKGSEVMSQALRLSQVKTRQIGEDMLVLGYPEAGDTPVKATVNEGEE
jgi:diaminohydroxyphosphoribosylaminopyrimidine deaminase/5-amino-6-(5-phosphoribosylamino)uracil reductase